jgi:hypothetical protein
MSNNGSYIKLHDVDDLLYSDVHCEISNKAKNNKPRQNVFDEMKNTDIFLSRKNKYYMTYYIIALNKQTTNYNQQDWLLQQIPLAMDKWATDTKLNDFEYIYDDILIVLNFLNKRFLDANPHLYKNNELTASNVFKTKTIITDKCGRQIMKKNDEMTAADYNTIDLWKDSKLYTDENNNRYCNKFPIWQYSMNTRQYETDNDGLHESNPERSSLNTQTRGYDMSNQIRGSEFYKDIYYESV